VARVVAVNREKFVVLAGNKMECAAGKDNVERTERVPLPQHPFPKVSESLSISLTGSSVLCSHCSSFGDRFAVVFWSLLEDDES
jgi:hypothetical protein